MPLFPLPISALANSGKFIKFRNFFDNMKRRKSSNEAKKEIYDTFKRAEQAFPDKEEANKIVKKARRIAMKHQIRLPKELKRKFCRHCYAYLQPGVNLRVRTREGMIVYYCLECRKFMRFPK
ncbi:ribonuclease P [Candidatus Woesearchaeota archaeon]|nr:ribonuclease P [Candidatus Woesearchaeota archaeon]